MSLAAEACEPVNVVTRGLIGRVDRDQPSGDNRTMLLSQGHATSPSVDSDCEDGVLRHLRLCQTTLQF